MPGKIRALDGPDAHAVMLGRASLVFCTLCVAGSFIVRNMPPVEMLIVDEAAQATEPETLIPLSSSPRCAGT